MEILFSVPGQFGLPEILASSTMYNQVSTDAEPSSSQNSNG
jgi:hypothetical protein